MMMTTISTNTPAGDDWNNLIGPDPIENLLFEQSAAPNLSADRHTLTYTIGANHVVFHSTLGFGLDLFSGIINGIDTPDFIATDMAIQTADFATAVLNGDIDTLNRLLWSGNDIINGGASNDVIHGLAGSDLIYGKDGDDRLFGDLGADRIFGGAGNDLLIGGAGNDQLSGDAGNDHLVGGLGDDRLIGGAGLDAIFGGQGADTFLFKVMSDFAPYTPNAPIPLDIIEDFHHGEGDKIDLQAIDANTAMAGNQAFTFIGSAAFTANHPGTLHVVATTTANTYLVEINTNNDAKPDASFLVFTMGGPMPTVDDFIL